MAVVKVPMVEVEVILLIMAQVVTIIVKIISIGHHFHIFLLTQSDIFSGFGSGGYNQGHGSGGDFEFFSGGTSTESSQALSLTQGT